MSTFNKFNLRQSLQCGLINHIPLQPTWFREVFKEIQTAWQLLADYLGLSERQTERGFLFLNLTTDCYLRNGANTNQGKHQRANSTLWSSTACSEIDFLLEHFYFSGLDKASNNICIICKYHVRQKALLRLEVTHFAYIHLDMELNVVELQGQIEVLLFEITFCYASLLYLMAISKLHKHKYRWFTNAADCIFSGSASVVTQILKQLLIELKL